MSQKLDLQPSGKLQEGIGNREKSSSWEKAGELGQDVCC